VNWQDVEQALVDAAELAELIRSHDVVFALTDTRESRWLPTALCRRFNKPLLNVALGFDSWLVMRHGVDSTRLVQGRMCPVAGSPGAASAAGGAASSGESLCGPATAGCYFCSDVVAPLNSMTGRTLDQQCTVTRPGLAPIAASHAVELLVNLLHHPLRAAAPTPERAPRKDTAASASSEPDEAAASALAGTASAASGSSTGAVPHQLRGFIADFSVLKLEQESFDCCSACSPAIVNLLDADMPGFLRRVLADPDVLETESGLERIKAEAEAMAGDWDGDDASW
jgi:ubiquitin-like modifier-activating enzyme ATG7